MPTDLFADLTPAQCQAVRAIHGPVLVLAAAGSGKTRVITRRIAHMLKEGIDGHSILALTFTNKAAGEMRHRVQTLAPDSGVWLGTFHGLCARLLRQYAPLLGIDRGFTIYDQADRLRAIKSVMQDLEADQLGVRPEQVENVISRAKNDMLLPEHYTHQHAPDHVAAVVKAVYPRYQDRLRELAALDFDDLLMGMVTVLRQNRDVRAALDQRFSYILVDEYQDTNIAQYAILRALSLDHPNLCVTGDPDQSIYGWRGANLNNILEFENDYKGCQVVKLERNYRSTKNILKVADHLIRHNVKRKAKALTTENPDGLPVAFTRYATEADEAAGVVAEIQSLVRDGEFAHSDIAVFVRMGALTRPIESSLRGDKIPYQIIGGVAFYERQEIKDVLAYLNLLNNPKDDLAFLRVVNLPTRGLGKTTLDHLATRSRQLGIPMLAMAREAAAVPGVRDKAARSLRDFTMLIDELAPLRDRSVEEFLRLLLKRTGYHDYLLADDGPSAEDRVANVDELVSAARQFDHEHPGAPLSEFLEQISLASAVDGWEDGSGNVTLMTLHAAKGLEFPVVFVVGLEQGILPHARSSESLSQIEEERRLLFVGITRARQQLHLSHCLVREFRGQRSSTIPSSFLAELPHDAMSLTDRAETGFPMRTAPHPRLSRVDTGPVMKGFRLTTAANLADNAASGSTADDAPINLDAFQTGQAVLHPEYGLGKITSLEGAGPERKARVAFAIGGERTFILALSKLRPIQRKTLPPPPRRP